MSSPADLRKSLERLKGRKEQLELDISCLHEKLVVLGDDLAKHEKAREIVKEVSIKTQQQLQYHINDITSLALEAVFPDPYKLEIEFVQRRNKTECDLYFVRDENKTDPMTASGGGAVDIASFALRIASWSMLRPNTRPTIVLDEPMRFVSEDLVDKASQMIKEVSQKLGLQFIIITHEPKLAAYADKTFVVKKRKGVSHVNTI